MTKEEMFFHEIADRLPDISKGKVFGAIGIKTDNGKTAGIFWQNEMIFKLNEEDEKEALKLKESRPGTHLYAPERKMKNWVAIPFLHSDNWEDLINKSILNLTN